MPDTGPELVSMAQQFTGLPMDSLIGGPLNAAANANAAMALTQTAFLLDTCFTRVVIGKDGKPVSPQPKATDPLPAGDTYSYSPIMIQMSLTRGVITPGDPNATDAKLKVTNIQEIVTSFNLPLLTIVPLNSLAVETVDITFEMEVKSSYSDEQSQTQTTERKAEGSFEAKIGWGPFSVDIKGSASYDSKDSSTHATHYQKSNSAKYTVNVHAGQLPLPQGVTTIIQAFTNAIQPIQMPVPAGQQQKQP